MDTLIDKKQNVEKFKIACAQFFDRIGLLELRVYGRFLQLPVPSKLTKHEIIQELIRVLCGEYQPKRNGKRGKPPRNTTVSPKILETVATLKEEYFGNPTQSEATPSKAMPTESTMNTEEKPPLPECLDLRLSVNLKDLDGNQKELLFRFLQSL